MCTSCPGKRKAKQPTARVMYLGISAPRGTAVVLCSISSRQRPASGSRKHETFWVERGKADKPVVIFTVGTMPNSRHAMCDVCLAWYLILFESVEAVGGEQSEEEKRSEESERQTGRRRT